VKESITASAFSAFR